VKNNKGLQKHKETSLKGLAQGAGLDWSLILSISSSLTVAARRTSMDVIFDSVVRREAGSTDDSSSSMPTSKGAAVVALILYLIPTVWIWIGEPEPSLSRSFAGLAGGADCC